MGRRVHGWKWRQAESVSSSLHVWKGPVGLTSLSGVPRDEWWNLRAKPPCIHLPLQFSAAKQTPRLCIFLADQQGPAGFHGHWSVSKTQLDHVLSSKYSIWTLTQQISSRMLREEGRQRNERLLCANQLLKTLEWFSPEFPPCLQQILLPCMRCPPGRWLWERWDHTLAKVSRSIRVLGIQTQLFGFAQQGLCPLDHPLSPPKSVYLFCVYLTTVCKPGKCILLEWLCS